MNTFLHLCVLAAFVDAHGVQALSQCFNRLRRYEDLEPVDIEIWHARNRRRHVGKRPTDMTVRRQRQSMLTR